MVTFITIMLVRNLVRFGALKLMDTSFQMKKQVHGILMSSTLKDRLQLLMLEI